MLMVTYCGSINDKNLSMNLKIRTLPKLLFQVRKLTTEAYFMEASVRTRGELSTPTPRVSSTTRKHIFSVPLPEVHIGFVLFHNLEDFPPHPKK